MSMLAFGDVSDVVDRINAEATTLKSPAQHAWFTNPLDSFDSEIPSCVVYPNQQFSSQSRDSPVCRQLSQIGVTVLIVAPITELGVVVEDIRKALLGWQVGTNYGIMKFSHQNIPYAMPVEIKADHIWWSELYEVEYLNRTI